MQEKYQIFISSTYTDLIAERECVREAILSMEQFPYGMEMFSANDKEQWYTIKDKIDGSDFYVLIIAHRYGSVIESGEDKGISYTEKEYRYAKQIGKPILAFIMDDSVPVLPQNFDHGDKYDKLVHFKEDVKTNRIVEWWKDKNDLAKKVVLALHKQISGEEGTKINKNETVQNTIYNISGGSQVNIANDNGHIQSIQNNNFMDWKEKTDENNAIDYFQKFNIPKKTVNTEPTDLEKKQFMASSFKQIVDLLIKLGKQYEKENVGIHIQVEKVDTRTVIYEIYANGNLKRGLKIFLGNMLGSKQENIMISENVSFGGTSFNGIYEAKVDKGELKLFAAFSFLNSQQLMTIDEAVTDIWTSYIQPYL